MKASTDLSACALGLVLLGTGVASAEVIDGRVKIGSQGRSFRDQSGYFEVVARQQDGNGDAYRASLDVDGRFQIQVLESKPLRLTWERTRPLSTHAIWPVRHPLLAAAMFHSDFTYRAIADIHEAMRQRAVDSIRQGAFRDANEVIDQLLTVYSRVEPIKSIASLRFKLLQEVCEVALEYHNEQTAGLSEENVVLLSSWWRDQVLVARSISAREVARALNGWAGFARQVYRPQALQWTGETVKKVKLRKGGYRKVLREDIEFIKRQLEQEELVSLAEGIRKRSEQGRNPDVALALSFGRAINSGDVDAISMLTLVRFLGALAT